MTGNIKRAVRIRKRLVRVGPIVAEFWVVMPARTIGKGSRTQIGPAHLNREQAAKWAADHGYLPLGTQPR